MDIENKKCKNCFIILFLLYVLILSKLGSKSQLIKSSRREENNDTTKNNENENFNSNDILKRFSRTAENNNINAVYNDPFKKSTYKSEEQLIDEDYSKEINNKNHENYILKNNSQMNSLNTNNEKFSFVNKKEGNAYKNGKEFNETNYYNTDLPHFIDENINIIPNIYNFTGIKKKEDNLKDDFNYNKKEMNEQERNETEKKNEKHDIEKEKYQEKSEKLIISNNSNTFNEKKKETDNREIYKEESVNQEINKGNLNNLNKGEGENLNIIAMNKTHGNNNELVEKSKNKIKFDYNLMNEKKEMNDLHRNSINNYGNNYIHLYSDQKTKEDIIDALVHNQDAEYLKKNSSIFYDSNNNKENENMKTTSENKNSNIKNNSNKKLVLDNTYYTYFNNSIEADIYKADDNISNSADFMEKYNSAKNSSLNYIGNNTGIIDKKNENIYVNNNDNIKSDNDGSDNSNKDNDISDNNNDNDNNNDSNNNDNDNVNSDSNNKNNNNGDNNNDDNNNDDKNNNDKNKNYNNNKDNNNNNLSKYSEKENESIELKEFSNINKNNSSKRKEDSGTNSNFKGIVLNIYFTENMNLYMKVKVGGQLLNLSLNSRLEGIYVFMKDSQACYKYNNEKNCYDPSISKTSTWCNNDLICLPPILTRPYECYSEKNLNIENKVEYPNIYFDSLKFSESHIEGSDDVEIVDIVDTNNLNNHKNLFLYENSNIKLVVDITLYKNWSLFKDTDGIIGLAGKELSCRNYSVWNNISEKNNLLFAFDINLPENATKKYVPEENENVKKITTEYKDSLNKFMENSKIIKSFKHELCKKEMKYCQAHSKDPEEELDDKKKKDYKNKNGRKEGSTNKKKLLNKEDSIIYNGSNELKGKVKNNYYVINPSTNIFNSEIHIGDYKKDYGSIIWAEPRERGGIFSDSFMQFTIYNLEVCNKNIFGKYSSNWQGVIDLSSKCLVLPKFFWLSLMEYLPINKNDERCIPKNKNAEIDENTIPRMCSVDEKNRPLPVLKFVFSDNDIVCDNNINSVDTNLQEISIPLDNLIINENGQDKNYLCIIPDTQEGRSSEYNGRTTKPLIKFGTYVLNNLYVVVDQENYRVGFAHKKSYNYSNDKCTQKMECIGDQFYEPALNICVDPDCSIWYFYKLNNETKKCESLSPRFYFFIIILIALLILDIQSYYFYRKSVHVAKVSSR